MLSMGKEGAVALWRILFRLDKFFDDELIDITKENGQCVPGQESTIPLPGLAKSTPASIDDGIHSIIRIVPGALPHSNLKSPALDRNASGLNFEDVKGTEDSKRLVTLPIPIGAYSVTQHSISAKKPVPVKKDSGHDQFMAILLSGLGCSDAEKASMSAEVESSKELFSKPPMECEVIRRCVSITNTSHENN